MIEENFYGGILLRDQASPLDRWGQQVADDLLCPRFHMTRLQAVRARLMRNFRFIFLFLLGVVVFTPKVEAPELAYWSHPGHPGEDIPSIDV